MRPSPVSGPWPFTGSGAVRRQARPTMKYPGASGPWCHTTASPRCSSSAIRSGCSRVKSPSGSGHSVTAATRYPACSSSSIARRGLE